MDKKHPGHPPIDLKDKTRDCLVVFSSQFHCQNCHPNPKLGIHGMASKKAAQRIQRTLQGACNAVLTSHDSESLKHNNAYKI